MKISYFFVNAVSSCVPVNQKPSTSSLRIYKLVNVENISLFSHDSIQSMFEDVKNHPESFCISKRHWLSLFSPKAIPFFFNSKKFIISVVNFSRHNCINHEITASHRGKQQVNFSYLLFLWGFWQFQNTRILISFFLIFRGAFLTRTWIFNILTAN